MLTAIVGQRWVVAPVMIGLLAAWVATHVRRRLEAGAELDLDVDEARLR